MSIPVILKALSRRFVTASLALMLLRSDVSADNTKSATKQASGSKPAVSYHFICE
jgi:hypothetical protein